MLSGKFLPAHPRLLTGESLSCWITRLAHQNGLKTQTFSERLFGKQFQVWNRDLDHNAPAWLVKILSEKTGVPVNKIYKATAKLYEKRLFPTLHAGGQLRWFMPLKKHHRKPTGYGQQFCPLCLGTDNTPYLRLSWRLAFYTFCPIHRVLMLDRCHGCRAPVAPYRLEQGRPKLTEVESLDACWQCGTPLSTGRTEEVFFKPKTLFDRLANLLRVVDRQFVNSGAINFDRLTLVHQLCRLMCSQKYQHNLLSYLCKQKMLSHDDLRFEMGTFEQRTVADRHTLMRLALWLAGNRGRLIRAIEAKAIHLNWLYRDLDFKSKEYALNQTQEADYR